MASLTVRQARQRLEQAVARRAIALTRNVASRATATKHMKAVLDARRVLNRVIRQGQFKRR